MTPPNHSEIEDKFVADELAYESFRDWCESRALKPYQFLQAEGPDVYYGNQCGHVVRHRWGGGAGELTVKLRKTSGSITDRVEIDLLFSNKNSVNDVTSFLLATGWERELTIFKTAEIYDFQLPSGLGIYLSLYDVERFSDDLQCFVDRRRFLEVEVDKEFPISNELKVGVLRTLRSRLQRDLGLGAPTDLSIYELYSGKTYLTVP